MGRYDVIVIGGGPGGSQAAVRAAQLGLRVALVEREPALGGDALHSGCIPSRLLLHASGLYRAARDGGHATLGIVGDVRLDLPQMMAHKRATVDAIAADFDAKLRSHSVTVLTGTARFGGPGELRVFGRDGSVVRLSATHVVIATGSEPIPFAGAGFDHERILDSADALALEQVPADLVVVGGGATGIEIGSIWQRLGARVTLVERSARLGPWLDDDVSAVLARALRRQGMIIRTGADVSAIRRDGDGVRIRIRDAAGEHETTADRVLVAIGRRPAVAGLGLAAVGLAPDADGRIPRQGFRTAAAGVWLIGDAAAGRMLAHKAGEEAIACAEQIAGLPGFVDYGLMPSALFTSPEVAMIGGTERDLQHAGIDYRVGRLSFTTNLRARLEGVAEGFVKLLVDRCSNLVVGAHLVGPDAAELISEIAVAMDASTICEDLARITYAHPTFSEVLRQAAMAAGGWSTES